MIQEPYEQYALVQMDLLDWNDDSNLLPSSIHYARLLPYIIEKEFTFITRYKKVWQYRCSPSLKRAVNKAPA